MNKWLCYLVVFCSIALVGCSKTKSSKHYLHEWVHPEGKLKVLSTTTMIDDLVGLIGKEHLVHVCLIKGELDPHSYELVKGDDMLLSEASVIFYNGLGLEHGASLNYYLTHNDKAFSLGSMIKEDPSVEFIESEGQIDPHIWMDVDLFSKCIYPIVDILSKLDPEHALDYRENGKELYERMQALDKAILLQMHEIEDADRHLMTTHDAFFYFARRYLSEDKEEPMNVWKERFAAPEGMSPDGQISPRDIQQMIEYAEKYHVRVVFPESNLNKDALEKVVSVLKHRGKKAQLSKEPLYGDTMGEKGSGADSYLKMIEHNTKVIYDYLKRKDL